MRRLLALTALAYFLSVSSPAMAQDNAPVMTAPATASGLPGTLISFVVFASDPDGDAITSLTAAPLPAGATFSANATNTSGTFQWTPPACGSSATVTFTAANALSGAATTVITAQCPDRAPILTAPAAVSGMEGSLLTFSVSASDPDGEAISTLTASGSAITAGGTFAAGAGNIRGTLNWTPTFTQAGTYSVTFTASNSLSGSAVTSIDVANVDRAPVVTAPATRSACENTLLTFTVGAIDPDGDAIVSLTATGTVMTAGATFTAGSGNASGTLSWTPTFTAAGTYTATFTARNTLTGSAATSITVGGCDRAPVVAAPATASGTEGSLITFTVTASDPDGQSITTFTASGTAISAGATFTAGAGNTSGTLNWTPTSTQAGTYSATFFAANALGATATTNITVADGDHAPVVTAPPAQSACVGLPLEFTVAASDADGDAIASLTAAGTAIIAGGTFTSGAGNTSGTFSWTPSTSGSFTTTFTASNALSGSASTSISVGCGVLPFVGAPATISGPEGSPLTFTVTASESDGPALVSLTASGTAITAGATFTAGAPSPGGSNISGTFDWTPDFTQAGTYSVTFTATSNFPGTASTNITVTDCIRTPALAAPSHVAAAIGVPVSFIVGAATCGGESLTLTGSGLPPGSDFLVAADQRSGAFTWTPGSDQVGSWPVTFTATVDGGSLSNSTTTVIDVAPPLVARAFTVNTYGTIRLGSEKAFWCALVEAIGGSFSVNDIVRTSVVLMSPGTGSVPQISANGGKFLVVGDADKNDVEDANLCFRKEDLRLLFSDVSGKTTLNVTLAGTLTSGREFSAPLSVEVVGGGGNLAAFVTPNPLNPSGILSFVSTRSGVASVRIFSQTGRLVRTLEQGTLQEGRHEVRIDGRDEGGRALATGIYFYRVDLEEGTLTGRFAILK